MLFSGRGQTSAEYDEQWKQLDDFIRYNPGARHRRRLLVNMLRGLSFTSVLDVGCGPGEVLLTLQRAFPGPLRLHGADFTPELIQRNKQRFPEMTFSILNIEQAALPDTFDLVVCSEVVEHLHDRRSAIKHLAAMVASGGHLAITCPSGKVYATEIEFGHVSHPTTMELQDAAGQSGLRLVKSRMWGWPTYKLLKELTNIRPEWAMRQFGNGRYGPWKLFVNHALYWANFVNLPSSALGCQQFLLFQK